MKKKFKRILLKLSGEGLAGERGFGIDENVLATLAESICSVYHEGLSLCVVIGGGNFFRGISNQNKDIPRPVADQVGMLATVMNAVFLKGALNSRGIRAEVLSALAIPQIADAYSYRSAQKLLVENSVIIFAGGTGNPYFSTDTGAVLRALETGCDAVFKATQVDGVYDSDPKKNPAAKHFAEISYADVISKGLKVMDMTAVSLAKENSLPIVVFNQKDEHSLPDVLQNKGKYTIIE